MENKVFSLMRDLKRGDHVKGGDELIRWKIVLHQPEVKKPWSGIIPLNISGRRRKKGGGACGIQML